MQNGQTENKFNIYDLLHSTGSIHQANGLKSFHVSKKEIIFHAGRKSNGLFVIQEGAVKLVNYSSDGEEKVIDIVKKGEMIGDDSLYLGVSHAATAQAIVDSVIIFIPEKIFDDLLKKSVGFSRHMLATMAFRIHNLIIDIESSYFKSGHQRVADLILSLLPNNQKNKPDVHIELPAKKIDIASKLNLAPQHLSRIFQDFRKRGLISIDGSTVHIPSPDRLRNGDMRFI